MDLIKPPKPEPTWLQPFLAYCHTRTYEKNVEVMRQGVYNPDALVWDASYDTAEKTRLAFEGAPSPTAITICVASGKALPASANKR